MKLLYESSLIWNILNLITSIKTFPGHNITHNSNPELLVQEDPGIYWQMRCEK
jgi:hypothetical protein